tara:strand:- start:20530 stop:21618 length:1089 start_codon:yes stop_codon:yes gene_type:complete
MAISFKTLTQDDKTTSRTLLHEAIPITGTLLSGTYSSSRPYRETNIKTYSHGMFQSVYDYPFASSSANHIFDITAGFSTASSAHGSLSSSATATADASQQSKKVNIYNQMAQVLVGYDSNGKVRRFDQDGDLSSGAKHENVVFLNFARLLVKDEIKKGSFSMVLGNQSWLTPFKAGSSPHAGVTITDADAANSYKVNSPAGEYGVLKQGTVKVGLIYYQAGIVVLNLSASLGAAQMMQHNASQSADLVFTKESIDTLADGLRRRIKSISFNNTTELNSSIFFCRANHKEFNYSSNPTYLDGSKIRVKKTGDLTNERESLPLSYITTVGLYSPKNELLAVAKLSEPLRKDPTNELTLRVRLDY